MGSEADPVEPSETLDWSQATALMRVPLSLLSTLGFFHLACT